MKLTKQQEFTLKSVAFANHYLQDAYLEVGACKPFNINCVKSLVKRGLITTTPIYLGINTVYANLTWEAKKMVTVVSNRSGVSVMVDN
jgi:hypothetical protein